MANVKLPDGKILEVADGATVLDAVKQIGPGLAKAALAAYIDGKMVDLSTPISGDCQMNVVTARDEAGLELMRHSCAHVMAEAICDLWPDAKLVYGPAVRDGFYYDIDLDTPITPEDFEKIEARMAEIAKADLPYKRVEMTRDEALAHVVGDRYKTDNINRADGDVMSFYSHGFGFEDLCRGPHVPSTSRIGTFKVMSVAGAYWHGDSTQKVLQRVYGTTWPDKKALNEYLTRIEEAKKRDHRVLGKQLDLFSFHEEGPGFAFLHPKGMVIWNAVIDFWKELHDEYDYAEIKTPIMLNEQLWHRSGHWDNYQENMYFTSVDDVDYAIKPMNCPGCCLVYKSNKHSYREFPIRMAELGLVHRFEASGALHGLVRVRQFTQDDAHVFCTPSQIESEVISIIDMIYAIYKAFGFEDFHVELSTKPEKHIGSDEIWEKSTNALRSALEHKQIDFKVNEGDGAFYGPKIDFHIEDCIGRSWQLGTIQLDFSMPQRFELEYTDSDNTEKTPVMLHRAILGSLERFMGILIEHYAGSMPPWLAPEHVRILPISDKTADYADKIRQQLKDAGIRSSVDKSPDKIGIKIAKGHAEKPPYMLVVGPKEAQENAVNVRIRGVKENKTIPVSQFIAILRDKIDSRSLETDFSI
ncbi:Threonine--tRNA ligase 2 [Limihaloglobus sulfuriphilus]|uniref:Threonine--tRNA ligase n=1 Tax=Limihaloglobus sulfuriphilus TaxID=1851148 RepID=A0A1Q2MDG8_9BACT|nr:threonine--tRNA ligase [Limihaloglobus sulfuriphilus]AQQ70684.1 Threonine--tRNA ligase 2 [Limihaloglobus sulfuriphilus]